jgi:hypothetical protein
MNTSAAIIDVQARGAGLEAGGGDQEGMSFPRLVPLDPRQA